MTVVFADRGWEDFCYWLEHDRKMATRIVRLIKDIDREPFEGLGKPEPLRHDFAGFWSRRIIAERRLVYAVEKGEIQIAQARYHY
ncbi:MAG: Txe/YoeB family addiction module toxin [Kiritimatiellae bacterium]|nr:Txe/YoeB family addiction module toxin [Kiritimatiellia bacterium]